METVQHVSEEKCTA